MITPKIKALFQFIEYLHSNINNFNLNNDLIKELEQLDKEKKQLKPRNNYKDKQQYDKVQVEIKKKFNLLQTNTASLIKAKATELNVCGFENDPNYSFNGVEAEILQLKDNFSNEDLPEIFKHKSKYLEYRTKTHKSFWSLEMFFVDLDRLLKEFFDFFADSETETDVLKETVVKVENFKELALYISKGVTLTDFINENKKKALAIDLKSYGALGYQTLQKQKLNPNKEFIQRAITELKNNLTNCLVNNNHISDKSKQPIYLRDIRLYLEYSNLLEQPQQAERQKPEPKETELSERIKKHFGFFNRNCPRKHKQILNDTDFEKLIEWTIWYFENDFKVPEISEPIKVVNTNKTFVQLAFKYLFKELHKSSPYPETLFDFYQSAFNPYSEDKKSNFEAVKNNDEVKKLMQIDYKI